MMKKPLIAISTGDPAGIGPEISVKTCVREELFATARPFLVGSRVVLERTVEELRYSTRIEEVASPEKGDYKPGVINLFECGDLDLQSCKMGTVQASCGRAAYEYVHKGVSLALEGKADAVTTAPINKESLKKAGFPYIGHTEILAELTGIRDPLTMFEVEGLRIFFLTRHTSLLEAIGMVKKQRLKEYIVRCVDALRRLGTEKGTFAVAALNPHGGEGEMFGHEEVHEIIPAITEMKSMGYDVTGPVGADSVFHMALKGMFSGVLALYHDQGHIAAKTFDFERTVSLTLGLPFLRTSVDHGTAFDIAGFGKASETNMVEAVKVAAKYVPLYRYSV
jgi:4-hydroxythreonine-4-phosphate dehydrogenase